MSDSDPGPKRKVGLITMITTEWKAGLRGRVTLLVWAVVAGLGIYLVATGIVGILTKAG